MARVHNLGGGTSRAHPGHVAGRWYLPLRASLVGGGTLPANTIRLLPFVLQADMTVSDLGCWVSAAATGNAQLAIYASDPVTKQATGAALAATGSIDTGTTGAKSADITGADVALTPGLYWMGVNCSASPAFAALPVAETIVSELIGSTALTNVFGDANWSVFCLQFAHTFGTWPTLVPASLSEVGTAGTCVVALKAA